MRINEIITKEKNALIDFFKFSQLLQKKKKVEREAKRHQEKRKSLF